MRIDKFLKVSRIIKRRTVAADACDGGRIKINGHDAKPAKDVKVDDVVTVAFGAQKITFRVLKLSDNSTKTSAEEMYEIIEG